MKNKLAFSLVIACVLLVATSVWMAPSTTTISWQVLGGGGLRLTIGSVTVEGTLGQPVTAIVSQSDRELCSGYWCGVQFVDQIYLPYIRR